MSSPILRNIPHLTKDNGPPNGTEGREQGFSTFNHMSTDEQIPPCPKKIPINPSSTKIGNRGYTGKHLIGLCARDGLTRAIDHNGRRQGTGAPSQLNWGDVHPTGWGPEFYPEGETPGSPTEINSPTRYLIGAPPHKSQSSRRQSTRVRIPTWKAQEIKDMELLGKVRGLSYRVHKKSAKGSKKRQVRGIMYGTYYSNAYFRLMVP